MTYPINLGLRGALVDDERSALRHELLDQIRKHNYFGFQGLIAEYAERDFVWDQFEVDRIRPGATPVAVYRIGDDGALLPEVHAGDPPNEFFAVLESTRQIAIGFANESFAEIVELNGDFSVLMN